MTTVTEPVKMDPGVKALWLEALRSGKYEQGNSVLRTADGKYCCLGVLCDIAAMNGVIPLPTKTERAVDAGGGEIAAFYFGNDTGLDRWGYDNDPDESRQLAYLPKSVVAWAGVPRYGDRYWAEGAEHPESLAALNDAGKSFTEIADIIEAEY